MQLSPVSGKMFAAKLLLNLYRASIWLPRLLLWQKCFTADGQDILGKVKDTTVYAETYFPYFHYGWHPLSMVQIPMQRLEMGARAVALDVSSQQTMSPAEDLVDALVQMQGEHPKNTQQETTAEQEAVTTSVGLSKQFCVS